MSLVLTFFFIVACGVARPDNSFKENGDIIARSIGKYPLVLFASLILQFAIYYESVNEFEAFIAIVGALITIKVAFETKETIAMLLGCYLLSFSVISVADIYVFSNTLHGIDDATFCASVLSVATTKVIFEVFSKIDKIY